MGTWKPRKVSASFNAAFSELLFHNTDLVFHAIESGMEDSLEVYVIIKKEGRKENQKGGIRGGGRKKKKKENKNVDSELNPTWANKISITTTKIFKFPDIKPHEI